MQRSFWKDLARACCCALLVSFAQAADPPHAYVASSNCLQVYDTSGPIQTAALPSAIYPFSIKLSPDNKFLYVADFYNGTNVQVFNASTLALVATIPGTSLTSDIAVLPDGSALYLAIWTGTYGGVAIVDTTTNTVAKYMPEASGTPYGIVASPDGAYVYVAAGWGYVHVINTRTRTLETSIPFNPPGYFYPYSGYPSLGLGITPDGKRLYVPNQDGFVYVVDTTSRSIVAQVNMGGEDWYRSDNVAISADGLHAYISREYLSTVTLIDTTTNMVSGQIPISGPFGIAMTGDGRSAFLASPGANAVYLINTSTNSAVPLAPGCTTPYSVAVPVTRPNVNQYLTLTGLSGKLETTPCTPGSIYDVVSTWKNSSATETLTNFYTQIGTLTGGNQLIGFSYSPSMVGPGATLGATFRIQLAACKSFNFTINVLGVPFP